MNHKLTYRESALHVAVKRIGGGILLLANSISSLKYVCVMLCLSGIAFFVSSCEPSAVEDEMGTRADTARVQTVPIGMTITINTDWAGDTTIYYSKKR